MGSFFSSHGETPEFDPTKDLMDLTGKVMIVTGGNSGIGYTTVQQLARRGAKVYIGARNEERAKTAIERLRADGLEPGNGELEWLELDLSDPRKTKESAEAFIAKERRLDVLVHNAGVMRVPYKINTTYGLQENMLVNHVSPFVFTKNLLSILTQTAKEPDSDVRVILLSSRMIAALKWKDVHFRDINDFNEEYGHPPTASLYRYAYSKLANVLFAKQLQKRFDFEGIPVTAMSLHPGGVYTEGSTKDPLAQIPILGHLVKFILRKLFVSAAEGAYTSAFAAASPLVKAEREKYKGAFLWPPGNIISPPCRQAESQELAEELWATTESILQSFDL
ncbi:NAD-P-binding protein [Lenzites betulinus]|nr:NAD-P-binding protein [Lenzites betulinus]